MSKRKKILLLALILISVFSIFHLTMVVLFSYGSQSSLSPKSEQLNFQNFVLPFLLTVGLIINFIFRISFRKETKPAVFPLLLVLLGSSIALIWQIKILKWVIGSSQILEICSISWGIIATIGSLVIAFLDSKIIKIKIFGG